MRSAQLALAWLLKRKVALGRGIPVLNVTEIGRKLWRQIATFCSLSGFLSLPSFVF